MNRQNKRALFGRHTPDYWWDFDGDSIIVESNACDAVVKRYPFVNGASAAVAQAETLIADLYAGRVHLKGLGVR